MPHVTPGKRTDELIKSALRFGKKREIELVHIVNRSQSTVRDHLKDLENENEVLIENELGHRYYYRPDEIKEPVEPKPSANDEQVGITLDILEDYFASESGGTTDIESWAAPEVRSELYDAPENIITAILYFNRLSSEKYHVVSDDKNLNKLLHILDELVAMFDDENSTRSVSNTMLGPVSSIFEGDHELQLPDEIYVIFFLSIADIHTNWEKGKEHAKFREELLERTDKIAQNSIRMPDRFADGLQHLVFIVDQEKGEQMFQRMFRSKDFDMGTIEDISNRIYVSTNRINKLFNFLDSLERKDPEEYGDEIGELKRRITKKF